MKDPSDEQIRDFLARGYGPDKIVREITGRTYDPLHMRVVVEKTKYEGTWRTVTASPEAVADARDKRRPMPRWKELAAMVFGEADADPMTVHRRAHVT